MGYISHCYTEEPTQGLFMAAPSWFVVNSQATPEQQAAAFAFLDYMATTEAGANYMVKEAGMVPAFKSVSILPSGQFSKALVEASARGGNYNWYFGMNPDGFNQYTLGPIFELYGVDKDLDAFVADVTAAFATLGK
jgi:raffinose/stachyose/melibiose transport system substrate-binding protein